MKKILFIITIQFLISCSCNDPKFVRKYITNNDISITWYYYSYISDDSPDFIVVKKNGEGKEIYKATDVITGVYIKQRKIVIKLFEPSRGIVYTKNVLKEVYGYQIILDSSATYDDYRHTPDGVKESSWW